MARLRREVGGSCEPWVKAREAIYDSLNKLKRLDKVSYYKLMLAVGEYASEKMIDQLVLKDPNVQELLAKAEKIPVMYGPHSDTHKTAENLVEHLQVGSTSTIKQRFTKKPVSMIESPGTDNYWLGPMKLSH